MFDIKEQLKTVPDHPGIYIMKDAGGHILYIGKSKSLKKRVSSYFQNFSRHPLRIQTMVANVREFEYILTDTEMEALILEANLIKRHKPRFNVLLKDDKAYPYIKVTVQEDFPRVFKTRQVLKDKARYFGPYTSAGMVDRTIEIIQKLFPIRKCSRDMRRVAERPCLNFHIRQCLGPCQGNVHREAYRHHVESILRFLGGHTEELVKSLEAEMQAASAAMEFERAAELRDNIQALTSLRERQKMVSSSEGDQDVIHFAQADTRTCMMIFFIRGGHLIGREQYLFDDTADVPPAELIAGFIQQFYSGTALIPGEILMPVALEDQPLLEAWLKGLKGSRVRLAVPERGEKKKLVELVGTNAREYLEKFGRTPWGATRSPGCRGCWGFRRPLPGSRPTTSPTSPAFMRWAPWWSMRTAGRRTATTGGSRSRPSRAPTMWAACRRCCSAGSSGGWGSRPGLRGPGMPASAGFRT